MHTRSEAQRSTAGLRSIRLLANAPEEVLQTLSEQCVWRRYHAGGPILSKNARDRDVYFIVSGVVRVTSFSTGGKQITYRDSSAGDWFGDLAAIDGGPRSVDVVAQSDSMLACLHAADFLQLVKSVAPVSEALIAHLVGRVRDLTERLFDLSTLGVQNRVDAELLRLAHEAGVVGNIAHIKPVPNQANIASKVSTYREQVTREVSLLTRLGILSRAGGVMVVRDVAGLERLVTHARHSS